LDSLQVLNHTLSFHLRCNVQWHDSTVGLEQIG
jgi:hypothetical protein